MTTFTVFPAHRHAGAWSVLEIPRGSEDPRSVSGVSSHQTQYVVLRFAFASGDSPGVCGVVALNTVCFAPFAFASGDPVGVCGFCATCVCEGRLSRCRRIVVWSVGLKLNWTFCSTNLIRTRMPGPLRSAPANHSLERHGSKRDLLHCRGPPNTT